MGIYLIHFSLLLLDPTNLGRMHFSCWIECHRKTIVVFVSLIQLEMAYDRSKVERDMFSIAAMQPNFVRGGIDHYHDGFSCYFGRHHIYRPYVGNLGTGE